MGLQHIISVSFMRLYYIGYSHTRIFSLLPGKKALTHNKNRKIESRRVGRHYKRAGGVVSGPRLPGEKELGWEWGGGVGCWEDSGNTLVINDASPVERDPRRGEHNWFGGTTTRCFGCRWACDDGGWSRTPE